MEIKEKGAELTKDTFPPYLADLVEPFLYGERTDWITKDENFKHKYGERGHMSRLLGILMSAENWAEAVNDDKMNAIMHEKLKKISDIFAAGVDPNDYNMNGTSKNTAFSDETIDPSKHDNHPIEEPGIDPKTGKRIADHNEL
jgi:hypothetical protein